MTKLRKGLAIILSIVMVLTIVPAMSYSAETKAAETFAITSPANNKLVAAGYIDIEWEAATSSEVEKYELYIDDELVTTTTGTSYEYYTTKVKAFETYVKAIFTDGTSTETEAITFGVSKKGLGLATDMGANINLTDMGCSWYYNWAENPSSGSQYAGVEFVPMVWKETSANNFKNRVESAKNKGYKYILTFNEPDLQGQCDMPVNSVYNVWQGIDNMTGIKISSPVTAIWPKASTNWFQVFMNRIDVNSDYDPDFISIHCYPDNYAGYGMAEWFLEEVVDAAWEMYHKPIWITEFSTTGNVSVEGTAEFWAGVMPELDKREYVERYAAFCFNTSGSNGRAGLWNYGTGELSEGGWEYKLHGNPENFTPASAEDTSTYTIKSERRNSLLDGTKTINNVNCENYTDAEGVTATATSEIGNQGLASLAIDNNINSRWESKHKEDPASLTIDLGEEKSIKEVDIVWENASASLYEIQVSADGENWTTVATGTGTGGRCDMITLKNQVSARYVRMYGISRSTDYGYSIYDMAVYGTDDVKVDETTTAETTTSNNETRTTRPPLTTAPPRMTTADSTTASNNNGTNDETSADIKVTTQNVEESGESVKIGKTKVKKATKKASAKKIKITLKKIKGANKYQIQISKKKKFNKKNILVKKTVKKVKVTINKKKLANKKKLYVRARAVKVVNGVKYYGKWSAKKKVKIK